MSAPDSAVACAKLACEIGREKPEADAIDIARACVDEVYFFAVGAPKARVTLGLETTT